MKYRSYLLKLILMGSVAIGAASCNSNVCMNVFCGNHGSCVDGACQCDAGFENDDCNTETRLKFLGNYVSHGTIGCGIAGNFNFADENLTVSNGTTIEQVIVSFSDVVLMGQITGADISIGPTSEAQFTYIGSGSILDDVLSLELIRQETNGSTCDYNITAIRQ